MTILWSDMSDRAKKIFLDAVLESSSSLLAVVDSEGTIVFVNSATEKLFGYVPSELIKKPIEILLAEEFHNGY